MCASGWSNAHADFASVGFYTLVDYRKSYAGTAYMPSRRYPTLEKGFENALAFVTWNAGPFIKNVDHDSFRLA